METIIQITAGVSTSDSIRWADSVSKMYRNFLEYFYNAEVSMRLLDPVTIIVEASGADLPDLSEETGVHRHSFLHSDGRRHHVFATVFVEGSNLRPDRKLRTYYSYPYSLVKDHISGAEDVGVDLVLLGDLREFI